MQSSYLHNVLDKLFCFLQLTNLTDLDLVQQLSTVSYMSDKQKQNGISQ